MKTRFGVFLATLLNGNSVSASFSETEQWYANNLKTYTATRQALSISDTPGSITILDKKLISELGLSNVEEALEYVPGMAILYKSDINQSVQYRGLNAYSPRRMRALMNGRPLHNAHYAELNWVLLPADIDNIERIEIVRGPAASSWGNNAFLGLANVITAHPEDTMGTMLSLRLSELGDQYLFARHGGHLGQGFYNVSIRQKELTGFESNALGKNRRDDDDIKGIDARTFHDITDWMTLELEAGYSTSDQEREYIHITQVTWPDIEQRDWYATANVKAAVYQHHSVELHASTVNINHQQEWRSCAPTVVFSPALGDLYLANPQYANAILAGKMPRGGTPEDDALAQSTLAEFNSLGPMASSLVTCGDTNQNYDLHSHEIELQGIYWHDDTMSIVSGIGYRVSQVRSITYYNGSRNQDTSRAFIHAIKRFNRWTLNASVSLDYEDLNGSNTSPKLAINYHLTESHSLRALWTKAFRTPDLREQAADWSYTIRNIDFNPFTDQDQLTFYPRDVSPGHIKSEVIISREIGYRGHWDETGLTVDLKFSRDSLYYLMSDRGALGDFILDNDSRTTLKVGELQINYNPLLSLSFLATYSYTDNESSHKNELTMSARHKGTVSVIYRASDEFSFSFSYLGTSKLDGKPLERATTNIPGKEALNQDSGASLDKLRISANRKFHLNDNGPDFTFKIGATHSLNDHPYSYSNNNYDDRTRVWLAFGLNF